jgi:hypothetical protein
MTKTSFSRPVEALSPELKTRRGWQQPINPQKKMAKFRLHNGFGRVLSKYAPSAPLVYFHMRITNAMNGTVLKGMEG